tara:strand:- start:7761 stop:8000 length:240 start_codon:yes stop_codon:yes gene_type:complete
MISGAEYSLKAISIITGVHFNTLHGRLVGKDAFTDHEIRAVDASQMSPEKRRKAGLGSTWPEFQTKNEAYSAKFLRVKL